MAEVSVTREATSNFVTFEIMLEKMCSRCPKKGCNITLWLKNFISLRTGQVLPILQLFSVYLKEISHKADSSKVFIPVVKKDYTNR